MFKTKNLKDRDSDRKLDRNLDRNLDRWLDRWLDRYLDRNLARKSQTKVIAEIKLIFGRHLKPIKLYVGQPIYGFFEHLSDERFFVASIWTLDHYHYGKRC